MKTTFKTNLKDNIIHAVSKKAHFTMFFPYCRLILVSKKPTGYQWPDFTWWHDSQYLSMKRSNDMGKAVSACKTNCPCKDTKNAERQCHIVLAAFPGSVYLEFSVNKQKERKTETSVSKHWYKVLKVMNQS